MKQRKSKKAYVEYLNGIYSFDDIYYNMAYLIRSPKDRILAEAGRYGDLIKKNDPIAFNVGFSEWHP